MTRAADTSRARAGRGAPRRAPLRLMVALSVAVHAAGILLAEAASSLLPPPPRPKVVTVELADPPPLPPEEPLPALAPAPRVTDAAPAKTAAAPARREEPPAAAQRWLRKLDASLARVPVAPTPGPSSGAAEAPGRRAAPPGKDPLEEDFVPRAADDANPALKKQLDQLQNAVRRAARRHIEVGPEKETMAIFGGTGRTGEPIPAWIRDMIRQKVRGYLPELETAYSSAIRRNPDLKGRLVVRFRIDPEGRIRHAEPVGDPIGDPSFVASVLEKVRRWTFEPTAGMAVEVLYPFVFVAPS